MNITEAYVDSLALNAAAMKNGKDLVKKNKLTKLSRSADNSLLFGEVQGSGQEPYRCSVDYLKPDSPTFRCSCPSRQFPCKHILGLMYAYAAGSKVTVEEIPQDIADKRDKAEKREEKKKEAANPEGEAPKPRKTNKSALAKKLTAQLEGFELLDKLLHQLVQTGLAGVDGPTLKSLEQQVKQLGNYYIPGAQAAYKELLLLFRADTDRESLYTAMIDRIAILHSLIKKSTAYLLARKDNPDLLMDTESTIEEWIGHAWQLAELREQGRIEGDAELIQLSFHSYLDESKDEYIDEGYWMHLNNGRIVTTRTFRPIRAAKYIKEDDSFFMVAQPKELAVYPGDLNPRVRWEEMTMRELTAADYATMRSHAQPSFAEAIKTVKNQLKNQLADKHPIMLLRFSSITIMNGQYVLMDSSGKQIPLRDIPWLFLSTTSLLPMLTGTQAENQLMLAMFEHRLDDGQLHAQPLSIITESDIVRLLY